MPHELYYVQATTYKMKFVYTTGSNKEIYVKRIFIDETFR